MSLCKKANLPQGKKQDDLNRSVSACRYREVYAMYKQAVASFWTVEEVDLSQDLRDWDRLSGKADVQHHV